MTETPPQPIMVVAYEYRLAQMWAREHRLDREGRGWIFVSDLRKVLGRHGPGTFVRLGGWGEAVRALERAGFTEMPANLVDPVSGAPS